MTFDFVQNDFDPKEWFKKEQGRFLQRARLKAGLSIEKVNGMLGIDIRWIESGEVGLRMKNLGFLTRFYSVSDDEFITWQQTVGNLLRRPKFH